MPIWKLLTVALPARYSFSLQRDSLSTSKFPFTITEKLPDSKQPQGYSPDDVIYFVMPDRFADGDPSNNKPPKSAEIYDRSKPRHYHGGDLAGLSQKLPYIKSLGMTAIWTTPIYDNNDGLDSRRFTPTRRTSRNLPLAITGTAQSTCMESMNTWATCPN